MLPSTQPTSSFFLLQTSIPLPTPLSPHKLLCFPSSSCLLIYPRHFLFLSTPYSLPILLAPPPLPQLSDLTSPTLSISLSDTPTSSHFFVHPLSTTKVYKIHPSHSITQTNFTTNFHPLLWKHQKIKKIEELKVFRPYGRIEMELERSCVGEGGFFYWTGDGGYVMEGERKEVKGWVGVRGMDLRRLEGDGEVVRVELGREYRVAVSVVSNTIAVWMVSEQEVIIIEKTANSQNQSTIFLVNLSSRSSLPILTLSSKLLDFKGINREFSLISFVTSHPLLPNLLIHRSHIDYIFSYKNKKIVFEREELDGWRNGERCYQKSQDLRGSVELVRERGEGMLVWRRVVERKKVVFHLVRESGVGRMYGEEGVMRKVIDLLY